MRDVAPAPPAPHPRTAPLLLAIVATAAVLVSIVLAVATGLVDWPGSDGSAGPFTSAGPTASVPSPPTPSTTPVTPAASASPTAAPTTSATAEPSILLKVDALAKIVVAGLRVRESPGFDGAAIGSSRIDATVYVIGGPRVVGGYDWYLVSALGLPPNSGCETPFTTDPFNCPVWLGWVAAGPPTAAWLEPIAPACPEPTDYRAVAALSPVMRLACFRESDLTLTAWWPGTPAEGECIDAPPADWLYCADAFTGVLAPSPDELDQLNIPVAVHPRSGMGLPPGGVWIEVTGHLDDPAAGECAVVPGNLGDELASASQVLACRATLVADHVREVAAP